MIKKNILIKKIILTPLLLAQWEISAITIKDILYTYSILAKHYKHLSIAHGAAFAESHLIRNYYEYGNLRESHKKQWLSSGDGPIRLIHALWTFINNNFLISSNPSYPAAHIQATTIANIIAFLENIHTKSQRADAKKLESIIVEEASFQTSIKATENQKKNLKDQYKREIKLKNDSLKKSTSEKQKKIKIDIMHLKKEYSQKLSKLDTSRLFKTLNNKKKN